MDIMGKDSSPFGKESERPGSGKDCAIKSKKQHLILCMLVILLSLYLLPISGSAEEAIVLSSFEELKDVCFNPSKATATFHCTSDNLIISDDIEIPSAMVITFRSFTVPEGITLSVKEGAQLRTYSFTVQGNLINRGNFIQQDLSVTRADDDIMIFALIPGHVENRGEMILTDVFGKRNINRFGGQLIIYETGSYENKRSIVFGDKEPITGIDPINTPAPTPALRDTNTVQKVSDLLEEVLPKLAFFLVLVCFFAVVKAGITSARKKNGKKRGIAFTGTAMDKSAGYHVEADTPSVQSDTSSGEDHFQRDKRKRLEQLDEWLKNGLIDRKEYNELKRRYREDR